jgi:ABC-type antimicrobial peptide transport system permease subunit
MVLLGVAGFMALVLSVVGLYGVVAYVVSRRRSEIGIRMALGADRRAVGTMVVLQSMQLGAIGVTIGLVGAALTMQLLRSLLFEVQPTDPVTLTTVAFFLLAVCALASLVPARRASSVSPLEALKS